MNSENIMNRISKPDKLFNFSSINLVPPVKTPGGTHYIKILSHDELLYIQSPTCITKQGIMGSGKNMFCDLIFSNENASFVEWIGKLESHIQAELFENRVKWFESELDINDIENYTISPLKIYKSGLYLLRTVVPTRLGVCSLKIFDEAENPVLSKDISNSTNMITILEIRGIKCTARSFQIDIEVKQILTLSPNNMFEKCVINTGKRQLNADDDLKLQDISNHDSDNEHVKIDSNISDVDIDDSEATSYEPLEKRLNTMNMSKDEEPVSEQCDNDEPDLEPELTFNDDNTCKSSEECLHDTSELTEVELVIPNDDTIMLSTRNEVYYRMYRDAIKKAKNVRNIALSAYLAAKQIKDEYMLDDIKDDDESDLDEDSFNFQSNNKHLVETDV